MPGFFFLCYSDSSIMKQQLPKIAIIGQTNVGKSSLFNRITQSRQAIVAREEGTTRDNVVRQSCFQDHCFWLIDTAGLKTPEDNFEALIQEQIEEASLIADLILVVVDACRSTDHKDKLIAKKALRTKKPVFLLLNKCDQKGVLPLDEFRSLGIKQIFYTSAEHNIGINDMLAEAVKNLPIKKTNLKDEQKIKVSLVGRPNVGKSQLFNSLTSKQQALVANVAGTTRDVNRQTVHYHKQAIELLDTAGIRQPGKQEVGVEKFSIARTLLAIEESDICLFLMDATEYNTQLDQRIAGIIKDAGKGLIVVITKWDIIEDKTAYTRDQIAPTISRTFNFIAWAPLIFTSSVTGQNVTKLFDLILEVYQNRQQKTKTSVLNKMLQSSIQSHPPAGLKNKHPKLRYIVQNDNNPPWFTIYGNQVEFLHWSYKRYLEKNLRETYNYSGTPINFSFINDSKSQEK